MAGLLLKIASCNSARHLPWLTIHWNRTSMLCYRSHPTVIYVMLWLKCTESILLADNFLIKEYSSFAKMISAVCASWFVGRFCTCTVCRYNSSSMSAMFEVYWKCQVHAAVELIQFVIISLACFPLLLFLPSSAIFSAFGFATFFCDLSCRWQIAPILTIAWTYKLWDLVWSRWFSRIEPNLQWKSISPTHKMRMVRLPGDDVLAGACCLREVWVILDVWTGIISSKRAFLLVTVANYNSLLWPLPPLPILTIYSSL